MIPVVMWSSHLPHFRLHDLRHFMATQMLAAGIPLALVAQRLNHARISATLNVYTHAIRAGDRPDAETLATLMTPAPRTGDALAAPTAGAPDAARSRCDVQS